MVDYPFHTQALKYDWDAALKKGRRSDIITAEDDALIREYIHEKMGRDSISQIRANTIVSKLVNFRRFLTAPYTAAHISDIYTATSGLKTGVSTKGKPFKQNTIHSYIRIVKPFLHWLIENEYSQLPEKRLAKIKAPGVDTQTTRPDEILSVQEIQSLIKACTWSRDRALISTLYESGCRVGELARMTWRDLIFDKHGVKCYIDDQKTKKRRYSRLTISAEHLGSWKKDCFDNSPDARVFVNLRTREPVEYFTVTRLIGRLQKASGIQKRITPHLFRKSRITHMIAQNYQESVIKQSMWGNLSTDMFSTYVCLAEQDIDSEFLDKSGIVVKADSVDRLLPIPCPNCHTINTVGSDYCYKCAFALSPQAVSTMSAMWDSILANPDQLAAHLRENKLPPA